MYVINVNIISILLMVWTIFLIARNMQLYQRKTIFFSSSCLVIVVLLLLEIIENRLIDINSYDFIFLRKIVNAVGFSITPLGIIFLVLFNYYEIDKKAKKWSIVLFWALFIIDVICSILSIWFPIVFSFDGLVYQRKAFFFIPSSTSLIYLILLLVVVKLKRRSYSNTEFGFLFISIVIGAISFLVQLLVKNVFLIWSSFSVALIVYYSLIQESRLQYDSMTGMKNRNLFEKDIIALENTVKVGIVIFDLNSLKYVNDNYGHLVGDKIIIDTSKIIQETFNQDYCYRIGGDEFVVLLKKTKNDDAKVLMEEFNKAIQEYNKTHELNIDVSYGYAFRNQTQDQSVMDVFRKADNDMYKMKETRKLYKK